jgi:hypothetical protein
MTIRLAFALILRLVAVRTMGQDQSAAHIRQPSMDVATVKLTLGMPRGKVLAQIQQAGYKLVELPAEGKDSRVGVTLRNIDDPMVLVDNEGELFFRDGALVRIQKQVAADRINTDRDLALSLYAVVHELEKEGSSGSCGVKTLAETPSLDTPGLEAKNIVVTCNAGNGVFRTILVRWVTTETRGSQLNVRVFKELWR